MKPPNTVQFTVNERIRSPNSILQYSVDYLPLNSSLMSLFKTIPSLKKQYLSLKGLFLLIAALSRDDKLHAMKPLRHLLYSF